MSNSLTVWKSILKRALARAFLDSSVKFLKKRYLSTSRIVRRRSGYGEMTYRWPATSLSGFKGVLDEPTLAKLLGKKPYSKPKLYEIKDAVLGELLPEAQMKGLKNISRKGFIMRRDYKNIEWDRHTVVGLSSRFAFPDSPAVAPGKTVEIYVRPQVPFMGQRLAVCVDCADAFVITGIRVRQREMTVQVDELPASLFTTPRPPNVFEVEGVVDNEGLARGERIDIHPAMPGDIISVQVRNTDMYPRIFSGGIFGRSPASW